MRAPIRNVAAVSVLACLLLVSTAQSAAAFTFGNPPVDSAPSSLVAPSIRQDDDPPCKVGTVVTSWPFHCISKSLRHPENRLWTLPGSDNMCNVAQHPFHGNTYQEYSQVQISKVDLKIERDGLYACPLPVMCGLKCVARKYECDIPRATLPCSCALLSDFKFFAIGPALQTSYSAAQWKKCNP
jgi:invasion protein IalB